MEHHLILVSMIFLSCLSTIWVQGSEATAAAPAAVGLRPPPNCRRRCGAVDIPYPFGIASDDPRCAIHQGFQLECRSADGIDRPFNGPLEVTRISVSDGKAWMNVQIYEQCYNSTTRAVQSTDGSQGLNFTGSPFRLSDQDNKIIVIGCNTLAYVRSDSYVSGCSPTCAEGNLMNGSCSSDAGCCTANVPKDIEYYNVYFNEDYNTSTLVGQQYSPCSYAVLMESAAFTFSTTYVTSTMFRDTYKGHVPAVIDWVITYNTCNSQDDTGVPSACVSDNSECVDSTNGQGYRCKCSNGYKGNPYIDGGCIDIDECLENIPFPCPGTCRNTEGSFICSCPRGKHMINGTCIRKEKPWMMPVTVGASVGIVLLLIVFTCAYLIRERKRLQHMKEKYFRQHGGLLLFEEMKSNQGVPFTIFSEEELQQATKKFDEQQVLGHGGHGTVYKGSLKDNVEVAVKRCMTVDEKQKKEFGKEMLILSQINHKNIVKLLGCCLEVEVPMLVYEFIPNNTLFHLIHGNHGLHISLATRVRIAHESAEALAYLHSCASPPILHGDVKSSNILLDKDYTAKVSDFGASILAPTDKSQFVTVVQGTCGYLDPEYMQTCQLTDKSDVYSFGVVLLEMLTGMMAFNLEEPGQEKSLSLRFLVAMKDGMLEGIFDNQIKSTENMEFLFEIAELAKQCLEMCGENRPSMKEVAEKLDRLRKVMQHPWAQENPEEMESLLGESSCVTKSMVESTGNFSIEKQAVKGLELGR